MYIGHYLFKYIYVKTRATRVSVVDDIQYRYYLVQQIQHVQAHDLIHHLNF